MPSLFALHCATEANEDGTDADTGGVYLLTERRESTSTVFFACVHFLSSSMQATEKAIEGSVVKPDGTAAKFVAECKADLANGYVFEAARRCESAQTTDRVAYYANLAFVRSVEDNRAEIQAIMRDMEYHHTGWTWVHTDEAVSLFKQNDTKSLVFDGICQAPLFELMFLLSEVSFFLFLLFRGCVYMYACAYAFFCLLCIHGRS
jgi:hypothetical protein